MPSSSRKEKYTEKERDTPSPTSPPSTSNTHTTPSHPHGGGVASKLPGFLRNKRDRGKSVSADYPPPKDKDGRSSPAMSVMSNSTGGSGMSSRKTSSSNNPVIVEPSSPTSSTSTPVMNSGYSSSTGGSGVSSLPTRLSGWFSHFSASSTDLSLPTLLSQHQSPSYHNSSTSTPGRGKLGAGASALLTAAKTGKAQMDKAMRYLLDSDAVPDKCGDDIWLLGVKHSGWEPSSLPPPGTPGTKTNSPPPSSFHESKLHGHGRRGSLDSGRKSKSTPPPMSNPLSQSVGPGAGPPISSSQSMTPMPPHHPSNPGWPPIFYHDFTSRVWLTYRGGFREPIKDGKLSELDVPGEWWEKWEKEMNERLQREKEELERSESTVKALEQSTTNDNDIYEEEEIINSPLDEEGDEPPIPPPRQLSHSPSNSTSNHSHSQSTEGDESFYSDIHHASSSQQPPPSHHIPNTTTRSRGHSQSSSRHVRSRTSTKGETAPPSSYSYTSDPHAQPNYPTNSLGRNLKWPFGPFSGSKTDLNDPSNMTSPSKGGSGRRDSKEKKSGRPSSSSGGKRSSLSNNNTLPPSPAAFPSPPYRPISSASSRHKTYNSDAGWGCMLRTGQSLLANALVFRWLGRDWRVPNEIFLGEGNPTSTLLESFHPSASPFSTMSKSVSSSLINPSISGLPTSKVETLKGLATYIEILTLFLDTPSPESPFSVHRMALAGKDLGTDVGMWFGPSVAAGALRTLVNAFPKCGLGVAVANDGLLTQEDVFRASYTPKDGVSTGKPRKKEPAPETWGDRPVLILVAVRLGIEGVNPIYYDTIKSLYTFPQVIGIAGGRPSSSYYFVGSQADSLFYLDPHFNRPGVEMRSSFGPALDGFGISPPPPSQSVMSDFEEIREKDTMKARPSGFAKKYSTDMDVPGPSMSPPKTRSRFLNRNSADRDLPAAPPRSDSASPMSFGSGSSSPVVLGQSAYSSWSPSASGFASDKGNSSVPPTLTPRDIHLLSSYNASELRTFHCERVRKMNISGLDPSMLIAFLCMNEADWRDWRARVSKLPRTIFSVQDLRPKYTSSWMPSDESGAEDRGVEPDMVSMDDDDMGMESFEIEGDEELEIEAEDARRQVPSAHRESSESPLPHPPANAAHQPGRSSSSTATTASSMSSTSKSYDNVDTEEDPVGPLTPGGFGSEDGRPSLSRGKPSGDGNGGDDIEDDWIVDDDLGIPDVVRSPQSIQSPAHQRLPVVERSHSPPPPISYSSSKESTSGKDGKDKKKKKKKTTSSHKGTGEVPVPVPTIKVPTPTNSRISSQYSKDNRDSGFSTSSGYYPFPVSTPSTADAADRDDPPEEILVSSSPFPVREDDLDDDEEIYYDAGASYGGAAWERERTKTAVAYDKPYQPTNSDGQSNPPRMHTARARDGGRTQSGGVKGVIQNR